MLKILFSPSEAKNSGGTQEASSLFSSDILREKIFAAYNAIITSNNEVALTHLFGIKDPKKYQGYLHTLDDCKKMPAIERYSGVAYQHLQYNELDAAAQTYIQEHLMIFSNLYGPILAKDRICNYKVKQGVNVGEVIPEQFYRENFSDALDAYLRSSDILDLRAGYYDKFYTIKKPYTTLKFLKNGRVVSHFAKAYRGIIAQAIAKHQIDSLEEFIAMPLDTLHVKQINTIKNKTEIIYDILS